MTDFTEQDLDGSTFTRVSLRGASFESVHLTDATLRDVDLSRTRVRSAYLDGVRMTHHSSPPHPQRSTAATVGWARIHALSEWRSV